MARSQEVGQRKRISIMICKLSFQAVVVCVPMENDKNKDDVKVGVQAKKGGGKGREIELTGEEKRLVEEVAQLLELDPDEVELEVPLVELGMDSMMLGQLQGIVSSDFNVDLESEELFTETCTLNLIFTMIKNGGCSPNFVKQEK